MRYPDDETETASEAAGAAEPSNGVTPVAKKAAKKATKKKVVAKKAAKKVAKKVAKKSAKKAGKKTAKKKANGLREVTGEGLAGQLRLNEGPRAKMAKHFEKNKGKFVTLASLAKAFEGDNAENLARQAVIRFRAKAEKYKLPYEFKTDEEQVGRYGFFVKR